jgi:hypothetical protein
MKGKRKCPHCRKMIGKPGMGSHLKAHWRAKEITWDEYMAYRGQMGLYPRDWADPDHMKVEPSKTRPVNVNVHFEELNLTLHTEIDHTRVDEVTRRVLEVLKEHSLAANS